MALTLELSWLLFELGLSSVFPSEGIMYFLPYAFALSYQQVTWCPKCCNTYLSHYYLSQHLSVSVNHSRNHLPCPDQWSSLFVVM